MSYYGDIGLATSAPINHNFNANYYNNHNNYDHNYRQKNYNYSSLPNAPYFHYPEYSEPYNFANYGGSIQRQPIPVFPIGIPIPISSTNNYPNPNAHSDNNQGYRSNSYDQGYLSQSASEYNSNYENTNSYNYHTANYRQNKYGAINSHSNSYNKSPPTNLHTRYPATEKRQAVKFKRTRQKLIKPLGSYLQRPAQRRSIGGTILRMMFFPMAFMQMMFFPVGFLAVLMMVGQIIYFIMPKPSLSIPDIPSLLRFDMDLDFTSNSTAEREAKTTMPTSRRPKITKLGLQAPPLPTLLDMAGVGPALMQLQALKDLKLRVVKKKNKMKGIESSEEDDEDGMMTQMSSMDDAEERHRKRVPSNSKTGRKKKRGNFKYSDIALKTLKTVYNHYAQN